MPNAVIVSALRGGLGAAFFEEHAAMGARSSPSAAQKRQKLQAKILTSAALT